MAYRSFGRSGQVLSPLRCAAFSSSPKFPHSSKEGPEMSNTDNQCQSLTILPECVASAPAKRPYVSPQLLTIGTAGDMVQGSALGNIIDVGGVAFAYSRS